MSETFNEVRTRFAPSPTGFMHVGNLRTALYAYLLARSSRGKFVLRIEDTDRNRLVKDAVKVIYNTMKLAGLSHDEGPTSAANTALTSRANASRFTRSMPKNWSKKERPITASAIKPRKPQKRNTPPKPSAMTAAAANSLPPKSKPTSPPASPM